MTVKNRLATWNLTDDELGDWMYNHLSQVHEPFNAREMSAELKRRGYKITTERIPHIVKADTRFKTKWLSARTDYRMVVFWV